jgi:quercetin dioxygenase-like cupin family protein
MVGLKIRDSREITWKTVREAVPERAANYERPLADSKVAHHDPSSTEALQLVEADYLSGVQIPVHSHKEAEIMYVLSGSIVMDGRELKSGSSVFIAPGTPYGFSAGHDGVRLAFFSSK